MLLCFVSREGHLFFINFKVNQICWVKHRIQSSNQNFLTSVMKEICTLLRRADYLQESFINSENLWSTPTGRKLFL